MNKLKLFIIFSKWAWVIFLPYIPVFLIGFLTSQYYLGTGYALLIMFIPSYIDFYYAGRIFLDFPRKYNELEKLNKIYKENGKVPKSLLYSMRCVKCEKVVEQTFEKLNNYQLD